MENFKWEQLNKRACTIRLLPPTPLDLLKVTIPSHIQGWTRISVTSKSENQYLSGVSIEDVRGERYRFRKTRKGNFDQVFKFSQGEKHIEINGLDLTSIQIVLRRSSVLQLIKRVIFSVIYDVLRLGIRQRNLRTVLQIIRARDFKSFQARLLQRYNQAPLASDIEDGTITPQIWMERFMSLTPHDLSLIEESISSQEFPSFSFVLVDPADLNNEKIFKKLTNQKLPAKETLLIENLVPSLKLDEEEWFIFLDAQTEVHEAATFALGFQANENPNVLMLIPDSAEKNENSYTKIRANPPWNLDLILGGDGVGPLLAIRGSVISELLKKGKDISEVRNLTELSLMVCSHFGEEIIGRLPLVLSAISEQSKQVDLEETANSYLRSINSEIFISGGLCSETRRIHWPMPIPEPKVSILIPNKDQSKLLRRCLEGIYETSEYSNFEVIVIDHQSQEKNTLELLKKVDKRDDTKVLNFEGSFNFSLMNNLAAKSATGDFICLLNNDIEVLSSDWIQELVSQAAREDVGVVGALLRYPDKSIQHAGLGPNLGSLYGHAHKYFPYENFGYRNRLAISHRVAAVTGACLMTPIDLWKKLGGLNEDLAVAYNDVDFCLRVRKSGYHVIWSPFAELIHHESLTRGYDEHPKQRERLAKETDLFVNLWKDFPDTDPAYSPNLTLESTNFSLSDQPNVLPPWRSQP